MDQVERIVRAYADAEVWLLELIAGAVASGATGTAGIYQQRLDALQDVLRQAEQYLAAIESGLLSEVAGAMLDGWEDGVAQATATIPGAPVAPVGSVEALAAETTAALASQRPAILRSVDDAYRQVVQQVSIRAVTSGAPIDTIMQSALDRFAMRGITSFTDRAGRRWGMQEYSRMALRTARNRAANVGRRDSFVANDIRLIQTSSHNAPAPVCEPYQGRILSLDGMAGDRTVWDRVTDGEITVHVTATLDEAEANGYHHPNCKHVDSAYIPGTPLPAPPEVDPEDYQAKQRQREMERHVRFWKRRKSVALTPLAEKQANAKIRAWQGQIKRHIDRHDFLRRNYSREQVRVGSPNNG